VCVVADLRRFRSLMRPSRAIPENATRSAEIFTPALSTVAIGSTVIGMHGFRRVPKLDAFPSESMHSVIRTYL
jgi:hypothetical protein